jgi:hypothetical protein
MAGYNLSNLQTDIRNYTEVDSNVFTSAILNRFIENAEYRIAYDLPMDSDRFVEQGTMATDVNNIRVPAGTLFVRGVEVFNASNSTEAGTWLERRDQTLAEAYSYLKGPTDMLTLYEQKYKTELQKFAAMQIGRRRRDDYTDGTIRIPIESPPQ